MDSISRELTAVEDAADLPAGGGAYALIIELARQITVTIGKRPPVTLDAGWYLYAGSARGPGGIRARVGRHLRRGKTVRWHVDRLTNSAGVAAVLAFAGGDECAITAALRARGMDAPVPGFGSSDCRRCASHLLALPDGFDTDDLHGTLPLAAMGGGAIVSWRRPPVTGGPRPPRRGPR